MRLSSSIGRASIVIVNQLAERLFGYSRQELLGMQIEGLVPQRFREHHAGYRNNYFREPHTRPMGEGKRTLRAP